ncbi:MAG: hypothetical protein ACD_2C00193G0012 [uncultured bacterium (gcode 4)]|uniref:Uncharacterized protein n=1 Tax=uncultured bacterium (gcode 4) TaxID=1234023 RepID=K2FDT7_9BACT|nr:MAG: hypothetical protein ACD_2C00193G0012 [uncultured bacterium (gcode 4)]
MTTKYSPWTPEALKLEKYDSDRQASLLQRSPAYTEASKINDKFNRLVRQNRIIEEIERSGIPDIGLIFSPEYITLLPEVLDKLFEWFLAEYRRCVETPKEKITFDILDGTDDEMWHRFNFLWALINQYKSSNDSEILRKIIDDFQPKLVALYNESGYSKVEYGLYKHCLENCEMDDEQKRIIGMTVKDYEKNGIHLPQDKIDRLKEMNLKMTKMRNKFANNLLDDEKSFVHVFEDDGDISEMPQDVLTKAKDKAESAWRKWYLFNINHADLSNILQYCSNSQTRKHFYVANETLAISWKKDNRKLALKMLKLREETASILWYDTYSEFILSDVMAWTPEKVLEVLNEWIPRALEKEKKEIAMLKEHFWLEELAMWDVAYYSRLYKLEKFNLDPKVTRRYYEIDTVIEWLFDIANRLYWIEMRESQEKTYKEWIRYYEVWKWEELKGYFILDPFAREGKTSWAWNSKIRNKRTINWKAVYPIVFNVASFMDTGKWRTLIWSEWTRTLFHEFWHMLHALCWKSKYPALIWTANLERDLVELFSVFMENYKNEPESLKTFARDFETGETIPEEIIKKYEMTDKIMSWTNLLRLLNFAMIDIRIHNEKCPRTVKELDRKVFEIAQSNTNLNMNEHEYKLLANFKHLFYWSYASFVYSYLWADITSTQVKSRFKAWKWMFDKEIAAEYHDKLMSQWSIKPGIEQFMDFTWEDINMEPFFREMGI